MSKLTNEEFKALIEGAIKLKNQGLRLGQGYMNMLHSIDPVLYNQISSTENDCFYDDSKIENFLNFLTQ